MKDKKEKYEKHSQQQQKTYEFYLKKKDKTKETQKNYIIS